MTKKTPPTLDQISIKQLRWLEAALVVKRNIERRNEETDTSPLTPDQISIKTLEILENDLAFKRNMTRRDDENDSSRLRIRLPQVTYTPPPPKTPWLALAAFGLVATGFFMGIWAALAWAFLL